MRCYSEPERSFRSYVSSPSCISEEVFPNQSFKLSASCLQALGAIRLYCQRMQTHMCTVYCVLCVCAHVCYM